MEQLTQAAINYSKKLNPGGSIDILEQSAFKAGAEWQKEQYQSIFEGIRADCEEVAKCLSNLQDRNYEKMLLQRIYNSMYPLT
jgi:hypothetical protein